MIYDSRVRWGRHAIVFAAVMAGLVVAAAFDGLAGLGFFNGLFLIGAAIPLALGLIISIVICLGKKVPFRLALSSPDVLMLLLVPLVWSSMLAFGSAKGLTNLLEIPLIGAVWGVCADVRTFFALRNRPSAGWAGAWVTLVIVMGLAALMGAFFPGLSE